MWRRTLGWGTFILVLLALVIVMVGPVGLRLILNGVQQSGTDISSKGIRGWLWDFTLLDARYQQLGVQLNAREARIQLDFSGLFSRTIGIDAALKDAVIDLDPSKLESGTGSNWQTRINRLQVDNTTLRLNGKSLNLPDAQVNLNSTSARELQADIQTQNGNLQARAAFEPDLSSFAIDFSGDASILKHYYPGIRAGSLNGQYTLKNGDIAGTVNISGGRVVVPEFDVVDVQNIQGTLQHQNNQITASLKGNGLGGPVQARATVDLEGQQWNVLADATPQLNRLGFEGLNGTGQLRIETGGWEKVKATAQYLGSVGYQDVQIPDAKIGYQLTEKLDSLVQASGQLRALGETAKLQADLKFVSNVWSGGATLQGPNVQARANIQNQLLTLTGKGFNVDLQGQYRLDRQTLQATASTRLQDFQKDVQGQVKVQASGPLDNLLLQVVDSEVRTDLTGPLSLNGTGRFQNGVLDLSTPHLDLTYRPSGSTWQVKEIPLQGIGVLNGSGNLVGQNLLGTVDLSGLPLQAQDVRGELSLNTSNLQFSFTSPELQAKGIPDDFNVLIRNYTFVGGVLQTLSGQVQVKNLSPRGQVRIRSAYQDVTATLDGLKSTLKGELQGPLKGLPVSGTADLENARLNLGGLLANIQYQPLQATVSQKGQSLNVSVQNGKINASGALPLDTFQKLYNLPISGQLAVDLQNSQGTATFSGNYLENQIEALFDVKPEQVTAQLKINGKDLQATAQGQVYPTANLNGTLNALGATSNLRVYGPLDRLKYQATGNTPAFVQGDLQLSSKPFNLQGNLTPQVTLNGNVGGLQVRLKDSNAFELAVTGQETLQYQSNTYRASLSGNWRPDWKGTVNARIEGPGVQATARGPWGQLMVDAVYRQQDLQLRAQVRLGLPNLAYSGTVSARYHDLNARGSVQGLGSQFRASATVVSPEQGTARLEARGLDDLRVQASNFVYQDITASGNLRYLQGKINGSLNARLQDHRLSVQALGESFTARLQSPLGQGTAEGNVDFSRYQVNLNSPYFDANVKGNLQGFSGTLNTLPQQFEVLKDQLQIPAQSFGLLGDFQKNRFALQQGNEEVVYADGALSGALSLDYRLRDTGTGQVQVRPTLQKVEVTLTGPLEGSGQVFPDVEANVRAPLALVQPLLPEAYQTALNPGQVFLQVSGPYSKLNFTARTENSQWNQKDLAVQANGYWTPDSYQASVQLKHPQATLQATLTPKNQSFSGNLDALLLPNVPEGLTGQVTVQGSLQNFDPQTLKASGNLDAALDSGNLKAKGSFDIQPGLQVHTRLNGTALENKAFSLVGQVYPRVNASVQLDQSSGTAQGSFDQLELTLKGRLLDQQVDVRLSTTETVQAVLSGSINGGQLDAKLNLATGVGALKLEGLDLQQTANLKGNLNLSAQLQSYQQVTAQVSGTAEDIQIEGDLLWQDGTLTARTAQASLQQGALQASGVIYPEMNLQGSGNLTDPVKAPFTFTAKGKPEKPVLVVQGTLTEPYQGLQLQGTKATIEVRDLQDILVNLSGAISGKVAGQYKQTFGLQEANLNFNLPIQREDLAGLLKGQLGWNGSFFGLLNFSGQLNKEPLLLEARGSNTGNLLLNGKYQQADFKGTVQKNVFDGLQAQLEVPNFDVSGLLGLKDPLVLNANASIEGPWNKLQVQAEGNLSENRTQQQVQFKLAQQDDLWTGTLTGAIAGEVQYTPENWRAQLATQTLNFAPFVPQLKTGLLTGNFKLSGTGTDLSTLQVEATGLQAIATDTQDNPIELAGSASYQSETATLNLQGQYDGSPLKIAGKYPDGLDVQIERFAVAGGELGLQGTVSGNLKDPAIRATGTFNHPQGNANLQVSGSLQDLLVKLQANLSGDVKGTASGTVQVKNLDLNTLQLNLTADAEGAGVLARGTIQGNYPDLRGQMRLQRGDAYVTLTGNGDGTYRLSDSNVATGTLAIAGNPPAFSGDVVLNAVPLLEGASGSTALKVNFKGNLDTLSAQYSGTVQQVQYQETRIASGTLEGTFEGPYLSPNLQLKTLLSGIQQQDLKVQTANLTLASRGAYASPDLKGSGTLSGVSYQQEKLGEITFSGTSQGNLQSPILELEADLKDLQYQNVLVSGGNLLVQSRGSLNQPEVYLTGDLNGLGYQDYQLDQLTLTGDYAGTWPKPDLQVMATGSGIGYQNNRAASSVLNLLVKHRADTSKLEGSLTGRIESLRSKTDQLGLLDFSGNVRGTLASPEAQISGKIRNLKWQDVVVGTGNVFATSEGNLDAPTVQIMADLEGAQYQQQKLQTLNLQATSQGKWQESSINLKASGTGIQLFGANAANIHVQGNSTGPWSAPSLQLNTTLSDLQYQEGSARQLQISGKSTGDLNNPNLSVTGGFQGLKYQDIQTTDGVFTANGPLKDFEVTLSQQGKTTLSFQKEQLTLDGLTLTGFDQTLAISGTAGLKEGNLQLRTEGPVNGQVAAQYQQTRALNLQSLTLEQLLQSYNLQLQPEVSYQGFQTRGRFALTEREWSGSGTLSGLPDWLSRGPVSYRVSGQDFPALQATLNSSGVQSNLTLNRTAATLAFLSTPEVQGTGTLTYQFEPGTFSGETGFIQKDTSVNLIGQEKTVQAILKKAQATISAQAQLNPLVVDVTLQDGEHQGTGQYTLEGWNLDIPEFKASSLGNTGYQGTVRLVGRGKGTTGTVELQTSGLQLPYTIPLLEEQVAGDLKARLELGEVIRAVGQYRGPLGTADLSVSNQNGWQGTLKANLKTSSNPGSLQADVKLENQSMDGNIQVNQFGYTFRDLEGVITGKIDIEDSFFTGNLQTRLDGGAVTLNGEGSLADVLPVLESIGIAPSEEGYLVTLSASAFPLEKLGYLPYARGRVFGTATLTSTSSTVNLRIPELSLPGSTPTEIQIGGIGPETPNNENRTVLSARLDGTFSGGDARFRGSIGDTTFVASSTDGVLVGNFDFRNTPVHALIGAFTDALPGQGLLTGTGRIDGKLSELDQLRLSVVAEAIKVTSAGQTLMGTGQFSLEQGALTVPGIQLSGAGNLNIQGKYAPNDVNLTANFQNATFTPLLALVPALKGYKPALQGNLSIRATGTYGQPTIQVEGSSLTGELAGIGLQLTNLTGALERNQIRFQSTASTTGLVKSNLQLTGNADLVAGKLENSRIEANGTTTVTNFGTLEGTALRLNQQGENWKLFLTGTRGGKLQASGDLLPDLNVRILLDEVQPELPNYYIQDSSVTGALTLVRAGEFYRLGGEVDLEKLQFTLSKPVTEKTDKEDTFEFESPLPTEYTTFPQRRQDQDRAALASWIFDDILIDAQNNIRIDENLVRAEFGGQLVLSGNAYAPRLQGDILPKRGSVFLRENEFVLNTAATSIRFNAADGAYPTINLQGNGSVRDGGQNVRVIMTVIGTFVPDPSDPRARKLETDTILREERELLGQCSDPVRNPNSNLPRCLDEASLYSLLVFGTKNLQDIPTELTQSAIRTTLQVFLVGEIERSIANALGIDVFRIRNYTIGQDNSFNAEFTVGTYLSREWYIQYQVDLLGNGNVQVQYSALDGKLALTLSSPLNRLDFNTVQPEIALAYNFDTQNSIELGIQTEESPQGERGFSVKLGYKLRF
ncbi:translocation/assembly module TamB domain-containing protein [Deinococcus misasensis]|uniref:translocation/assembly module TamB domain-containing protein n=1 Tax=Deinococcus misasensis TaxID=392413 RepID=UPI00055207F8|nr:hypothetical protein [Deinococcus misasensis]